VIAQRLGRAGDRRCQQRPTTDLRHGEFVTMELREGPGAQRRTQLQHRIRPERQDLNLGHDGFGRKPCLAIDGLQNFRLSKTVGMA